jgi:phage terminase large subunit
MKFNAKYQALWGDRKNIRYILVIGGRASGKSTAVAHWLHDISFDPENIILNTRFTMTSARDSVVAEIKKTIEYRQSEEFFLSQNNTLVNNFSNSKIIFKGLVTSRLDQTAALKGITDLNIWVLDEAEELKDVDLFDDVDETIRRVGTENLIVLILNSYRINKQHFIYKRFFEDRNVNWGHNGIIDNTMYIFTTCVDNWKNLNKSAQDKIRYFKQKYFERYQYRYLGLLREKAEGVIFTKWQYGEFNEGFSKRRVFGLDFGFRNAQALIQVTIDKENKKLYAKEIIYKTGQTKEMLIAELQQKNIGTENDIIVADTAEPSSITSMRNAGLKVMAVKKYRGCVTDWIKNLLTYEWIIEGKNIGTELNNYQWADKEAEVELDKHNHAIKAIMYAMRTAEQTSF